MLCSNQLSYVAKWRALFARLANVSTLFFEIFIHTIKSLADPRSTGVSRVGFSVNPGGWLDVGMGEGWTRLTPLLQGWCVSRVGYTVNPGGADVGVGEGRTRLTPLLQGTGVSRVGFGVNPGGG